MSEKEPEASFVPDSSSDEGNEEAGISKNNEKEKDKEEHLAEIDAIADATKHSNYFLTENNMFVRGVWKSMLDEERETGQKSELRQEFAPLKGGTLIDFGMGDFSASFMPYVAKTFEVKRYIGLDRYAENEAKLQDKLRDGAEFLPEETEVVGKDGLKFLARQPDNSASLCIFRLDRTIIDDSSSNKKYAEALAKEIARVVGKDNMVFGYESPVIFDVMRNSGLFEEKRMMESDRAAEFSIFRLKK